MTAAIFQLVGDRYQMLFWKLEEEEKEEEEGKKLAVIKYAQS